ncbi:MAG: hypothetical protein ACSHW1_08430 [Yoonia sp.]|uniref:hypothetical protein n=1 Tax=Yoonia sp. TaxID=2212373 RepID=UPI003EF31208
MKSILLTTTALVAFAGAAAADGHASVSWSGTATAGVAREGEETVQGGTAPAEIPAGEWSEYAEINTTAVGTVATDMGVTFSAAVSVDGGQGYDFADDDGFDDNAAFRGGFDYVKVDGGAYGVLTIDPNDIENPIDDDDDAHDVLYTNDFGVAAVTLAFDVDDDTPSDIDSQWYAGVTAPVADVATVFAEVDEAGGNNFGGSATFSGVKLSANSKLTAEDDTAGLDRDTVIGAEYSVSGLTVGAKYGLREDGNQWSVSAAYAMDAISVAASTNEAEEWEVTASYAISDAASLDMGVNYVDDAFVGVSFSF